MHIGFGVLHLRHSGNRLERAGVKQRQPREMSPARLPREVSLPAADRVLK